MEVSKSHNKTLNEDVFHWSIMGGEFFKCKKNTSCVVAFRITFFSALILVKNPIEDEPIWHCSSVLQIFNLPRWWKKTNVSGGVSPLKLNRILLIPSNTHTMFLFWSTIFPNLNLFEHLFRFFNLLRKRRKPNCPDVERNAWKSSHEGPFRYRFQPLVFHRNLTSKNKKKDPSFA